MQEYGFLMTRIPPHKGIIGDSVLIRENTGKWKPAFRNSLSSDVFSENIFINLEVIYRFYELIFNWLVNYGITWFPGFRKPRIKIITYGRAIPLAFRRFLKNIWFSILSAYCFLLNISVLSLTVFVLQFCAKYFEVKLRNQAKLDLAKRFSYVSVRVCCLMGTSAKSSLLQWKLDTKLFPIQF